MGHPLAQNGAALAPFRANGAHPSNIQYTIYNTGIFRSVVTKKRRESAHARILEGILNGELRACVDSRRFFVTTDLKNPVYTAVLQNLAKKIANRQTTCAKFPIHFQRETSRMR